MKIYKVLFLIIALSSQHTFAQQQPAYSSSEILLQIKKLNVLGSVLYIAAHPDDENNALLPYLTNEKFYRTAYLSLTRGDGGQNLIGEEQGIELGLIRTQELLAARKIDGAEQYFTRAYEFGFSKSAEEALKIWDREKILADVVWVIRKFQPDVIIKRFPPDKRAGHGHHAASAILADEAFTAAADPTKFPEQFKYGVKHWQAKRILWNTFNFGGNNTTNEDQLKIDIGGYNSLLGKSYGELGGEARTMHKSQGEGRPRNRGQSIQYFVTTAGEAAKTDLLDGIETSWKRLTGDEIIGAMIRTIITNYKIDEPELSVPAMIKVYQSIKALPKSVWRDKKLQEAQEIIEACSALFVEATSTQINTVQGDTLRINFVLNERKNINTILKGLSIENFDTTLSTSLPLNKNIFFTKTLDIADDKKISQPYWLVPHLKGGTFDVKDQQLIGKAESDPSFEATFIINIEGQDFLIKRPVQYKTVDPVRGEVYQPIVVLPKVELRYEKENYISVKNQNITVKTFVKHNLSGNENYDLVQHYSKNWRVANNESSLGQSVITNVFIPQTQAQNVVEEISGTEKSGAKIYDSYTRTIAYDHIPVITYFAKAKTNLLKIDLQTVGKKIGYIVGAGDKVPQALEAMGYTVTAISEADIKNDVLKQFDAVVVGIRAYNIHEYLSDKNDVLNRYVENGGNLIVQYLKSNQVGQKRIKAGPYTFSVDPSLRVTEENSNVKFLLPGHSALNYPNKITEKDFEGWVQERSTYQAVQLDQHFETPLAMNDTGEKESSGSLAIAKYGKGNFIYLSLVFFRQLPAGVPGAYRIMANLIALPQNQ